MLRGFFPQCDHVKILAFGCKWRNMQFDIQRNRYFLVPINCSCINENLRAVFGSFLREILYSIVIEKTFKGLMEYNMFLTQGYVG